MIEVEFGKPFDSRIFLALGYFDCVHEGHRKLIEITRSHAKKQNALCAVMTFEDSEFPLPNKDTRSLYTYEERTEEFADLGADVVIKVYFTKEFMKTGAHEFLELLAEYDLGGVFCGYDYTFGRNSEGNALLLKKFAESKGIPFYCMEKYEINGMRVSSTVIKDYLARGMIEEADKMLGRPFKITGRVTEGDGRGNSLGFPTANLICSKNKVLPADGVYSAECSTDGAVYKTMLHIGPRPTYGGGEKRIEAHLIGFCGTLYGRELTLRVKKRIRGVKEFSGSEQLKVQLRKDMEEVKNDSFWTER